jgi:flagellar M-ring protein FliF
MAEILARFKDYLRVPFNHLSQAQRLTMLMVFVLTIIGTVAVLKWATQPEYAILASDLEPADAQAVVEELKNDKVAYKLVQDGRGIMVPRKKVYEYRMKLAAQNLPTSTGSGYELFDKKDIGLSEFVQQVNYRRALEGELARTIQAIPEVIKARVHIVFPQQRLFKEDQKEPTASIFLSMRRGVQMSENQINGIVMLVSGSVEGLTPENVTVVDDHGKLLSRKRRSDTIAGLNDDQLDLQIRVENYLESKAQTMLDQLLGAGNAVVRLASELDFRRIEKTSEMYDSENAAVLSEEIQSQTSEDTSAGNNNSTEHTITNYQLPKSVERVINDVGSVKRLSVAVLVNGKYTEKQQPSGEKTYEFVPRPQGELQRLAALVRSAVGFNSERGDKLDIQCIPFENPFMMQDVPKPPMVWEKYMPIIQKIAVFALLLVGFLIVRSKIKKAKKILLQVGAKHGISGQLGGYDRDGAGGELTADGRRRKALPALNPASAEPIESEVVNFVKHNSQSAAQLVRAWMMEK